ncbi:Zinc finger protein 44 [Armadillidium nasatum]|uniref:Zinc finger protein 44 n=1 Tax=Armadillidium nasatum TaxID=96803 RepID=A0A5N5SM18_9CRUS|nr:Zinc finger protein 44 [Armadillidium nasatum]
MAFLNVLTAEEEKALKLKEARARNRGKPTPCPICGLVLSNTYNFNCHMRRHRNDKPFKCEHCPLSFILKQELKRHKVTHAIDRPYKCKVCTKGFKSIELLRVHMDCHGANDYKCRYCDEKFKRYKSRATHEIKFHTKGNLKCKYCYKSFVELKFKEQHEQTVHRKLLESPFNEKEKIVENITKKAFGLKDENPNTVGLEDMDKRRVYRRKKIKERETGAEFKFYPCKFCSERFQYREDQVTHYQDKHKESYDKVFSQCKICGKLLTKLHFKHHMMAHEGIFKHKCALCDYKSSRLQDLKIHMIVHFKDSKYSCSICKKTFRYKNSAMVCEKRHSGSKDKKCNLCERTFFSNFDLKKHVSYQHKQRKCPFCDFETSNRCFYERHKREHKKGNVLKRKVNSKVMCEICGRLILSRSYMSHMKSHGEFKDANTKSKEYFCYYCTYSGKSTSSILKHSISHHPEKVKYCKFCTYASLNPSNFRNHLKFHISGSGEDFYLRTCLERKEEFEEQNNAVECFICGYIASSVEEFSTHVEVHNESLSDFEWYYMDFFYCALKDRPNEIRAKDMKEIVNRFPPDDLTFVDIKETSLPVTLSSLLSDLKSEADDEEVEFLGYGKSDTFNTCVMKQNNFDKDCEIVSELVGLLPQKEDEEESLMNTDSFIEIDAEMNYCSESLTDSPPSTKNTNSIIKEKVVNEYKNDNDKNDDDKFIEIREENFENVTVKTKKYESQVEKIPQKLGSPNPKRTKFLFDLDILKSKMKNINGKLFLSLEDLCSVATIKKESANK